MRPQPKKARDALIEALEALQDPKALCKQRGHSEEYAYAYAAGVAKSCIEQALHALGEPIELYRPLGVPYHRAGRPAACGDEWSAPRARRALAADGKK